MTELIILYIHLQFGISSGIVADGSQAITGCEQLRTLQQMEGK
jgi:hypothetical protein